MAGRDAAAAVVRTGPDRAGLSGTEGEPRGVPADTVLPLRPPVPLPLLRRVRARLRRGVRSGRPHGRRCGSTPAGGADGGRAREKDVA